MQAEERPGGVVRALVDVVDPQAFIAGQRVNIVRREGVAGQVGEPLIRRAFDVCSHG